MIAAGAALGAAVAALVALVRLFAGPTLYDRVTAANSVTMRCVLAFAALAVVLGREDMVDAAIGLTFGLVVFNAAAMKFFRARSFQAPLARLDTSPREG